MIAVAPYLLILCASSAHPCPLDERRPETYTLTRGESPMKMRQYRAKLPTYAGYCLGRGGAVIDHNGNDRTR